MTPFNRLVRRVAGAPLRKKKATPFADIAGAFTTRFSGSRPKKSLVAGLSDRFTGLKPKNSFTEDMARKFYEPKKIGKKSCWCKGGFVVEYVGGSKIKKICDDCGGKGFIPIYDLE